MVVYIDPKFIAQTEMNVLIERHPDITFTNDDQNTDIEVLMIPWPKYITKERLDRLPNVKWIQLLSAGYDGTDFDLIHEKKLIFTNAKDIYHISMAEDVLGKILFLNRNYGHYYDNMKQGIWHPIRREPELFESTVGILGTGSIGQTIASRLKAFNTHIIGYRQTKESVPFFDEIVSDEEGLIHLLKQSDYVIITLPLSEKTKHLIDKEKLSYLKKNAILINVARGDIIDQDALLECLKKGSFRGAGLDVTTPEPLPPNHELWTLPNVLITPHNSSSSPKLLSRLVELMDDNLKRYKLNHPLKFIVKE